MNNEQYILVIGAAHIDVFANYERELSSKIDKPGKIDFSLGGTAFNIAANLAFGQEKNLPCCSGQSKQNQWTMCISVSECKEDKQ